MSAYKKPIIHQDNLFMVKSNNVEIYCENERLDFIWMTEIPFDDLIEEIRSEPEGVIVTTTHKFYIIFGGPQIATYYAQVITDREPGMVIARVGTLLAVGKVVG